MTNDDAAGLTAWRRAREERLLAPDAWLAVAGLDWLAEGLNTVGSAPGSAVKLPEGAAPAQVAALELDAGRLTLTPAPGVEIFCADQPVQGSLALEIAAEQGQSAAIRIGRLSLYALRRENLFGVRVYDPQNPARLNFGGLAWFPPDPAWRVEAQFVAEHTTLPIVNMLGQTEQAACPGYAEFEAAGRSLRLYPLGEMGAGELLWFIFRDQTAGESTYPAGRYLWADPPQAGRMTLDFNRAYNPPCAYTPHATCPLPPAQNRLPIAVTAGEKYPPLSVSPHSLSK